MRLLGLLLKSWWIRAFVLIAVSSVLLYVLGIALGLSAAKAADPDAVWSQLVDRVSRWSPVTKRIGTGVVQLSGAALFAWLVPPIAVVLEWYGVIKKFQKQGRKLRKYVLELLPTSLERFSEEIDAMQHGGCLFPNSRLDEFIRIVFDRTSSRRLFVTTLQPIDAIVQNVASLRWNQRLIDWPAGILWWRRTLVRCLVCDDFGSTFDPSQRSETTRTAFTQLVRSHHKCGIDLYYIQRKALEEDVLSQFGRHTLAQMDFALLDGEIVFGLRYDPATKRVYEESKDNVCYNLLFAREDKGDVHSYRSLLEELVKVCRHDEKQQSGEVFAEIRKRDWCDLYGLRYSRKVTACHNCPEKKKECRRHLGRGYRGTFILTARGRCARWLRLVRRALSRSRG